MRPLVLPGPRSPVLAQAATVILCGLGLAALIGRAPALIAVGVFFAAFYAIVVLQRPDLGLLIALVLRASTDALLRVLPVSPTGQTEGIAATLFTPNAALNLTLILAGGVIILARRVPFLSLPGGRLLVLLLIAGIPGMLRSGDLIASFNEWLPNVGVLVTYALAAYCFPRPAQMQRVVDAMAISFIAPALFGFYQLIGRGSFIYGVGLTRIFGTFVHPNTFALYLVLMLSVFSCQVLHQRGRRRLAAAAIVAAAGVLLLATFSRFAWIGAAIVLLTIGALRKRIIVFALSLIAILVAGLIPAVGARLDDPLGGSFADRAFNVWPSKLRQWLSETGVGETSLSVGLNRTVGLGPGSIDIVSERLGARAVSPHNDYLRVLFEYGLFGLVLYLALLVVLSTMAFRAWRGSVDLGGSAIALSFFSLTLAYPIMSITANIFAGTYNQIYFWSLAGLTAAIAQAAPSMGQRSSSQKSPVTH